MANILVSGGAGYIGSHTAHLLLQHGHKVTVVDNLSRGHRHNVASERLRELNLEDTDGIARVLVDEKIDAVIHFAAYIAVGESTKVPELYFANNVGGSVSLFTAMMRADVKRLVFSSTAAVYGMPERVPIPESLPFAPVNPYGESKVMVEKILGWMDSYRGLRSVALRYFNACGCDPESGLGEQHDPETHLIPLLFRAIDTDKPVTLFGDDYETPDGTCIRDYIHVSDLASAHIRALDHLLAGGASDAFNVGTGEGLSVLEVMQAVERVTGQKVPHTIGPRREGDPATLVADSSRLKTELGWQPTHSSIDEIVRDAWGFYQKHK